jgi:hypothetical protein
METFLPARVLLNNNLIWHMNFLALLNPPSCSSNTFLLVIIDLPQELSYTLNIHKGPPITPWTLELNNYTKRSILFLKNRPIENAKDIKQKEKIHKETPQTTLASGTCTPDRAQAARYQITD